MTDGVHRNPLWTPRGANGREVKKDVEDSTFRQHRQLTWLYGHGGNTLATPAKGTLFSRAKKEQPPAQARFWAMKTSLNKWQWLEIIKICSLTAVELSWKSITKRSGDFPKHSRSKHHAFQWFRRPRWNHKDTEKIFWSEWKCKQIYQKSVGHK